MHTSAGHRRCWQTRRRATRLMTQPSLVSISLPYLRRIWIATLLGKVLGRPYSSVGACSQLISVCLVVMQHLQPIMF